MSAAYQIKALLDFDALDDGEARRIAKRMIEVLQEVCPGCDAKLRAMNTNSPPRSIKVFIGETE